MLPSRRSFLRGIGGLAALAASGGAPRASDAGPGGGYAAAAERGAQPPRVRIRAIDAYQQALERLRGDNRVLPPLLRIFPA